MKIYKNNYAVGRSYGSVDVINRGTHLEYRKGSYTFYHGIVTFYCETKMATFSFVYSGRIYSMTISEITKPLSDRQLIIKGGKFGRAVVNDNAYRIK